MRKLISIFYLIAIITNGFTQTQYFKDSVYQKLHQEVNIVNRSSDRSDIVWEEILLPPGKDLQAYILSPNNDLYIGCNNGGVYKYNPNNESWDLIGLESYYISEFEVNESGGLLIVANGIYLWEDNTLEYLSDIYCNPLVYTFGPFFGANYFNVVRSIDGCSTWEVVYELQGASEIMNSFSSTSTDSILMSTTKYTGNGGGIYLSDDGGDSWSHFGLSDHFTKCIEVDMNNQIYAGNGGHYYTGQGGLYKYNYGIGIWDSVFYFPYVKSIVFNSENYIFVGFYLSGMEDGGGVMHSEDEGETWILDTTGMGNTWVHDLQIAENGIMYALTGYPEKHLYRTMTPVSIKEDIEVTNPNRKLIKLINLSGREITEPKNGVPYIEVYDDGSTRKRLDVR